MSDLTSLSKEQLLEHVEGLYDKAKPHQDALADGAIKIIEASREVYRRIIIKHIPEVKFCRTRVVTRLSCTTNCLGHPSQELARRLNQFAAQGVKITRVEYDENLHEYTFHADPIGDATKPTEV